MIAEEIADNFWIVRDDNEQSLGFLIKNLKRYFLLSNDKTMSAEFSSIDELNKEYPKIKFLIKKIEDKKDIFISNYPIKDQEAFDIEEISEGNKIPSYKKSTTSNIRYAAGYWGIKFSDQYVGAFCPKLTTVKDNESIGPFNDRFILNAEINKANKK